uniref:Uncharacterized protein n=1 Tax=Panagrolaimus sp. PS1159 TaxID=55785 RepID=A0AC35GWP4_9BILA
MSNPEFSKAAVVSFSSDVIDENPKSFPILLRNHKSLKAKHEFDTHEFKNVYIFCKKTMQLQDCEIRRLEEFIEGNEKEQREKFFKIQQQSKIEINELKLELERMKSENLLMMTQIGNQQQIELEMADMRKEMKEMKHEMALKDEKMNKRELREREIALITEQRVRKEVEKEFNTEIEKIAKELRIQNAAKIEANNHIINKLNKEILNHKTQIETTKLKLNETTEELLLLKKDNAMLEADKKRLEEHLNKASQQASVLHLPKN